MPQQDDSHSNPFLKFAPPGDFYSPIPDPAEVARYRATLFDRRVSNVPGVDIRADEQVALLQTFGSYYRDIPFKDEPTAGLRYYFANPFFSHGDAVILYSMLRHRAPRRVVEVGSGFSSAVMLDTNERFCRKQMRMTFIDPHPERLLALLSEEDTRQHDVIPDAVQSVSFEKFAELGANAANVIADVLQNLDRDIGASHRHLPSKVAEAQCDFCATVESPRDQGARADYGQVPAGASGARSV